MLNDHEFHPLRILDVVVETDDSRTFVLDVPDDLAATFAYRAGQFCTFQAVIGGEMVARCYSMSSSPDVGDRYAITVKRVPDGKMSNWMIDELAVGSTIDVLRPAGLFVLRDSDAPIIAFAGGSGITPVYSIIKSALATTTRPITLVYANRSADSVIFSDEIARLESDAGDRLTVHRHLDDERGFLDPAACAALAGPDPDADFYICGPGPYMDTVEAGLEQRGVARTNVFIERFVTPGDDTALTEVSATETVTITYDGEQVTTDYRIGETVLEVARRARLTPPSSCEGGSCGTCMAIVSDGLVTMRVNNALTPDEIEEGWVLTCQSLPTTPTVVVDYDA